MDDEDYPNLTFHDYYYHRDKRPKITRKWAMPNRWTFSIKPIKELINKYHSGNWVDPFAGQCSPAFLKNDLDPSHPHLNFCMDALTFLKSVPCSEYDGAFYDPPYSMRQASECYKSFGLEDQTAEVTSMKYWSESKDQLARIVRVGGCCICCGWNSMGLGKSRGFEMAEILLVPHGGNRNDTIVTVEFKKDE